MYVHFILNDSATMENDNSDSVDSNSQYSDTEETEKSFVKKVQSTVTGLFSSSLSKWFGNFEERNKSKVKRHEENENNDTTEPPRKRVKLIDLVHQDQGGHCTNSTIDLPLQQSTPLVNKTESKPPFTNFIEPTPGPSGIRSRKTITSPISTINKPNGNAQGVRLTEKDSVSSDSTSGYSSMAKLINKNKCDAKQAANRSIFGSGAGLANNRSLFADRTTSPVVNSSLSSRRPSFNVSTFGTPDFMDKTVSTKRVMDSPFYKGRTIYGGAATYSSKLKKHTVDMKTSLKESIQIKPVNKKSDHDVNSLSKTAQRILNTLEQYTTPVKDVKKIPLKRDSGQGGIISKYVSARPYILHERKTSSASQLHVPAVPELIKMKEKLQSSTESVRQIATSSNSLLNKEEYSLKTTEDEKSKHTNKMKTKISNIRQKTKSDEPIEDLGLVSVPLPITTLPKFDLTIPPPEAANVSSATEKPQEIGKTGSTTTFSIKATQPLEQIKDTSKVKKSTDAEEFKFSKPLVIAENLKSIVAINNFRFSKPLSKKQEKDETNNFKMPEKSCDFANRLKNNGEIVRTFNQFTTEGTVTAVQTKEDDSIMSKFKPAEGTWECPVCLVRNQSEKIKCIACESPKNKNQLKVPNKEMKNLQKNMSCTMHANIIDLDCTNCQKVQPKHQAKETGSESSAAKTWKCNNCLGENKNELLKCGTCETLRSSNQNISSDLCLKFKAPSDTWECPVCMIRNKNDLTKCAACETARQQEKITEKPPSLLVYKPPSNTWECPVCMIRNTDDKSKCAACETQKPGSQSVRNTELKVNKKSDEWECPTCMVKNSSSKCKCVCCETPKPGGSQSAGPTKIENTFNFGIGKVDACPFKFGIPTTTSESVSSGSSTSGTKDNIGFSFGNSNTKNGILSVPSTTASGSSFGSPNPKEQSVGSFTFGTKVTATVPPVVTAEKTATKASNSSKLPPSSSMEKQNTLIPKQLVVNGDISSNLLSKTVASNSDVKIKATTESASNVITPSINFNFGSKPVEKQESSKPVFKFEKPATTESKIQTMGSFKANAPPSGNLLLSSVRPTSKTKPSDPVNEVIKKPENSVFKFGSDEPPSKVAAFSFTAPASQTQDVSKTSTFSFGSQNTNATNTAPKMFTFTGSTPAGGFNFNMPKPVTTNATTNAAANIFGSTAASKNSGFNFGTVASTNSTQKAGFSFGGSSTFQNPSSLPTTQASAGFSFGSASATPAPGGFNFSAPEPNAKPMFNFTANTTAPAFTAQPSTDSSAGPARKMKKALRRTTPR